MSEFLEDLLKDSSESFEDGNYFLVTITELELGTTYPLQFKWKYKDGTVGKDWSASYNLLVPIATAPEDPEFLATDLVGGEKIITVRWSGKGVSGNLLTDIDRVDIHIAGASFGDGTKPAGFFKTSGTQTFAAEPGVYIVQLKVVTVNGATSFFSIARTVTVGSNTIDTSVIPGAPSSVTVAGFNDTSDPLNRTGYANVSWNAGSGAKGYWVGLWTSTPGSTDPIRQIETNGTSVRVDGLAVGSSYYIQVKSYNTFNNPSAWVPPLLNYPVLIPGNTTVPGAVTISGSGTPRSIVISWTEPATAANLVTSGGYYIAKLYTNSSGSGTPLETRTCFSNSATFAGLTTGTSYYVTVQPYTAGSSPVAGTLSNVFGPLVPTAVEPPDIQADFILANNQFQVGGTSGANDIHLSAYTKTVDGQSTKGRIYIGGPETSGSAAVGLYNSSGTPFYADNLGRLSLGDRLTWSGNSLNIKGTIDVTGPSTFSNYVIAGATNSTFIGIGYQVPYRLSSVLQTGANAINGIVLNSSGSVANSDWIKSDGTFRLAGGALKFNGTDLEASGTITAKELVANATLTSPIINAGIFQTSATAGNGTTSGIKINTNGIFGYSNDSSTPKFSVSSTGVLTAISGTIGGLTLSASAIQNLLIDPVSGLEISTFRLDSVGKARFGKSTGSAIIIDPSPTSGGAFLYHTANASLNTASNNFSFLENGGFRLGGTSGINYNGSNQITIGSSGNPITINTSTGSVSISGIVTVGNLTDGVTQISGDNITTGTISGRTITGGLIRTGTTGSRILISGSDQGTNPNAITFINPGGSPSAHIVPLNMGGTTYGLLMHEGGTADQTGGTYPQLFVGNGGVTMSARQFSGGPQGLVSVSNSGVAISGTNGADVNVTGPITFSDKMFAPNLTVLSSGATLRVATGSIGEIREGTDSSIRYKENVIDIQEIDNLNPNKLLEVPVRAFKYKENYLDPKDERFGIYVPGFIAEEMDEYYPIAVDHSEDGADRWNDSYLIPGMLSLIQNLNQELIDIKSRLDALEG